MILKETPEEVHIGPFTIKVEYQPDLVLTQQCRGLYHPKPPKKIVIDSASKGTEQAWEMLMYEIIEAVVGTYQLDLGHHNIGILGTGLAQALKPLYTQAEIHTQAEIPDTESKPYENPEKLNATEAITGFMMWLSNREETTIFPFTEPDNHYIGLVFDFSEANKLSFDVTNIVGDFCRHLNNFGDCLKFSRSYADTGISDIIKDYATAKNLPEVREWIAFKEKVVYPDESTHSEEPTNSDLLISEVIRGFMRWLISRDFLTCLSSSSLSVGIGAYGMSYYETTADTSYYTERCKARRYLCNAADDFINNEVIPFSHSNNLSDVNKIELISFVKWLIQQIEDSKISVMFSKRHGAFAAVNYADKYIAERQLPEARYGWEFRTKFPNESINKPKPVEYIYEFMRWLCMQNHLIVIKSSAAKSADDIKLIGKALTESGVAIYSSDDKNILKSQTDEFAKNHGINDDTIKDFVTWMVAKTEFSGKNLVITHNYNTCVDLVNEYVTKKKMLWDYKD